MEDCVNLKENLNYNPGKQVFKTKLCMYALYTFHCG